MTNSIDKVQWRHLFLKYTPPCCRQTTLCLKKWGTHIVLHNSHKNRALWIKFGTVNPKSISYNISLKLLMQRSTSCSHCHDKHPARAIVDYLCHLTSQHQNSSRPTSGHLTSLTWTLLTTEFRAVFRTGCIRNAYVTLMSWNSVWLRCGQSGHHWWGHHWWGYRWVEELTSGIHPNEGTSFWTLM